MLELGRLRYFLQIAEDGSFSAAAIHLGVAQPALSRQVRALEAGLGVQLLNRTGRGVSLTPAGRRLAEGGRALLREAAQLEREVAGFRLAVAGEAVAGMPPTIGRILALPLTVRARERLPQVSLRLVEEFSGTMVEWLVSGRVDVGVIYGDPGVTKILVEPLAEEELAVIARPDLLAPDGAGVSRKALAMLPLVLPSRRHSLRRLMEEEAARLGHDLNVVFEIDSLSALVQAARTGLGATVLPPAAVRAELALGDLEVRPLDPPLLRTLFLATGPRRAAAAPPAAVADLIRALMLEIAPGVGWRRLDRARA
jgi:LysR family nitrogen assimilation transcriptional regulator